MDCLYLSAKRGPPKGRKRAQSAATALGAVVPPRPVYIHQPYSYSYSTAPPGFASPSPFAYNAPGSGTWGPPRSYPPPPSPPQSQPMSRTYEGGRHAPYSRDYWPRVSQRAWPWPQEYAAAGPESPPRSAVFHHPAADPHRRIETWVKGCASSAAAPPPQSTPTPTPGPMSSYAASPTYPSYPTPSASASASYTTGPSYPGASCSTAGGATGMYPRPVSQWPEYRDAWAVTIAGSPDLPRDAAASYRQQQEVPLPSPASYDDENSYRGGGGGGGGGGAGYPEQRGLHSYHFVGE